MNKSVKLEINLRIVNNVQSTTLLYRRKLQIATGLLLVKCYDNKTGLGVFCLVIFPLARPLVPNPQKKKKKKNNNFC